jgi:hypothetical protein
MNKRKKKDSTQLEWLASRTLPTTNVDEDVGEKEPSYFAGGFVS